MREACDAESAPQLAARAIRKHDQHAKRRKRAREHLEKIARKRIEPVAILEHEHERSVAGLARARHSTRRLSSEVLRSFASNEAVRSLSGIGRSSRPASSGARGTSAGSIAASSRSRCCSLLVLRRAAVEPEQRRPDPAPDEVARVRAVRLAFAARRRERPAPSRCRRTRRSAATCRCRLRRPGRRCRLARRARRRAARAARRARQRVRPSASPGTTGARDACRVEPVSANTRDGSALPFTVIGASVSHVNPIAGGTADGLGDVDLAGRRADMSRAARLTASPRHVNVWRSRVAVRAAAQAPVRDADLDVGDRA